MRSPSVGMERGSFLADLSAVLENVATAMAVADVTTQRIEVANNAFRSVFASRGGSVVGVALKDLLRLDLQADDYRRVFSGELIGFNARSKLVSRDGDSFEADVSVTRVDITGREVVVATVQPAEVVDGSSIQARDDRAAPAALFVITDHDWLIRSVSVDVDRVWEARRQDIIGEPLLGLVHPSSANDFVLAAMRSVAVGGAVQTNTRLHPDVSWEYFSCTIAPLCTHQPPRLALAFKRPPTHTPDANATVAQLQQHLWRIAAEAMAADVWGERSPFAGRENHVELTTKQWEVAVRLANGERVSQISQRMYLSPSTVRNHLSAAYKRFGVRSQHELIAAMRSRQDQR